jgi:kynureninase
VSEAPVDAADAADDAREPLLAHRAGFPALDEAVWLCSHSLGCLPAAAAEDLTEYLELWQQRGADAWDAWLPMLDELGGHVEKLLSARRGTVTWLSNVSHVMAVVASCFDHDATRDGVVYGATEFPSVSYVWQGEARRGARVVVVPATADGELDVAAMCAAIDQRTRVVIVSQAHWATGAVVDVKAIVARARAVGAHVVLDVHQALGVLPIDIVELGVAFATGGTQAYLCGGPGAAFLYVRPDLIDSLAPRVTGWYGHESPFAFAMPAQSPADGIWRFLGGTPAPATLYQARAGLALVARIGARAIRERSLRATERAIAAIDARGFTLRTPRAPARRGASVAFDFVGAADIARELGRRKVRCDHRPGVGIRIAPHFYNRDDEVDAMFAELDLIRGGG